MTLGDQGPEMPVPPTAWWPLRMRRRSKRRRSDGRGA